MDVKVEGKGVVRFSDIATSNHASNPGDSPPMIYAAAMNLPSGACDAFNAEWMTTYGANECPEDIRRITSSTIARSREEAVRGLVNRRGAACPETGSPKRNLRPLLRPGENG